MRMVKKVKITGPVLSGHKEAAVELPFDPADRWGMALIPIIRGRRGFPVQGTFAGVPFETFVVARAKRFWILVDDELLRATDVAIGAPVTVVLEPRST